MTDILVADDSPTILNLLVIALTREGFDPVTAANGEEALERIREHRPRLVILDALMPRGEPRDRSGTRGGGRHRRIHGKPFSPARVLEILSAP